MKIYFDMQLGHIQKEKKSNVFLFDGLERKKTINI